MKLILASQNQGKIHEARVFLEPLAIELHSLAEYPQTAQLAVAETADSFAGNAQLKADAYFSKLQLPVLADDSGLEVIALNNEPGVASNRWYPGPDAARNTALLQRMEHQSDRRARFVTVLCLLESEHQPIFFRGEVTGQIAFEPVGNDGFGYDPIFIPDGYEQTFAEMGVALKNTLSHRARALTQLKEYLQNRNT